MNSKQIEAVENGLLFANLIKGRPVQGLNLAQRMAYYHVPGVSIAVINNGELEWAKGYGVLDASSERRVTERTCFQAASISKPVAAMAALALVDTGLLELDQDVNDVLKTWKLPENEFTRSEKVTLRRLLSHSAGLTVHGFPGYSAGEVIPTIQQILDGEPPANSGAVRVDVLPGSLYRYSGGGTTLVQLLVMEVTGKPFSEAMHELVLEKIGMESSTYEQPLSVERVEHAAVGHGFDGNPVAGGRHTHPEQAAAGLWTTPRDLARYVVEVQKSYLGQSNCILSQAMTREMLSIQIKDRGLGTSLGGKGRSTWFAHGGSNVGYRSEMIGFVHRGQGVVVMTNGDLGSSLAMEIVRSVAQVYDWQEFLPFEKESLVLSSQQMMEFTGKYAFVDSPEMSFVISVEDGHLSMVAEGFVPGRLELFASHENRLFCQIDGWELDFTPEEGSMRCDITMENTTIVTRKSN